MVSGLVGPAQNVLVPDGVLEQLHLLDSCGFDGLYGSCSGGLDVTKGLDKCDPLRGERIELVSIEAACSEFSFVVFPLEHERRCG